MTNWFFFLAVAAVLLSIPVAVLAVFDEDNERDGIDVGRGRKHCKGRNDFGADAVRLPRPKCIVCDSQGCEFCPRVDA